MIMQQEPVVVTVRCMTYNQAPYIRRCLEGFVMQITDFNFNVVVHDDASTDGTDTIIREFAKKYPNIIIPYFEKENLYQKKDGSLLRVMNYLTELAGGEFVAFCEGDDYWIDPNKLQKQIDYMKLHPQCGMCYTNFNILYEDRKTITESALTSHPALYPHMFTLEKWILRKGYVGPMTWLVRKELFLERPDVKTVDGSFVLFASFLARTQVGCLINETTAVYRRLDESASHSKSIDNQYNYLKGLKESQIALTMYYREILPDAEMLLENICKSYYNNMKYLILCAAIGNESELRLAASKDNKHIYLIKVLCFVCKYVFLRKVLGKLFVIAKKMHWFLYKRRIK